MILRENNLVILLSILRETYIAGKLVLIGYHLDT
jgi:hypothetical protein